MSNVSLPSHGYLMTAPGVMNRSRPSSFRSVLAVRRHGGYSVAEIMLLVGLGLMIAGITATYTLYAIRRQSQMDALTQRELFRLRTMLLTAHMRAQRGMSTTVTMPPPDLRLDFMHCPSAITFLTPDGRLQNPPDNNGMWFYAGKGSVWQRFAFREDGVAEITPISAPLTEPPDGGNTDPPSPPSAPDPPSDPDPPCNPDPPSDPDPPRNPDPPSDPDPPRNPDPKPYASQKQINFAPYVPLPVMPSQAMMLPPSRSTVIRSGNVQMGCQPEYETLSGNECRKQVDVS